MNVDVNSNNPSKERKMELRFQKFVLYFRRAALKQEPNRFFNKSFTAHVPRRQIIFDLLRPLADQLNFSPVTLFGAINLFDSAISRSLLSERQMKSIGLVCLSVSSKLNEVGPVSYTDLAVLGFCAEDLVQLEKSLVLKLAFRVNIKSHFHLIAEVLRFLSHQLEPAFFARLRQVVFSLSLVVCSSYLINQFTPVCLALTIFQIVENLIGFHLHLLPTIFQQAGLTEEDVHVCFRLLSQIIHEFQSDRNQTRQVKSELDPQPTRVDTASFLSFHR